MDKCLKLVTDDDDEVHSNQDILLAQFQVLQNKCNKLEWIDITIIKEYSDNAYHLIRLSKNLNTEITHVMLRGQHR